MRLPRANPITNPKLSQCILLNTSCLISQKDLIDHLDNQSTLNVIILGI